MASTVLIHIGDLHLAPGPRHADRLDALDQIICDARRTYHGRIGAWLLPGDLSHARQSIEDKNLLADRLLSMAEQAPVLIVYGNHDLPGDLDIFHRLQAKHPVIVCDKPMLIDQRLATGVRARIFALPYPTKAKLVALGIVPADIGDVAADTLEHVFQSAAAELESARLRGDLTFMIGHVNVAGAIASTGQPQIGREIEISARHLALLGPIYKGLNHIHKAQEIQGAVYAGSVCRLDWGEVDEKRYVVVHIGKGDEMRMGATDADGWLYEVTWRPIDVAPMFRFEALLTRVGVVWDQCDPLADRTDGFAGAEVRVRYRFKQSEKAALDHTLVTAPFGQAKRLQIEPIAIPDRAVRAPAVAEAKTLRDKVIAWAETVGTVASADVLDKLARLERGDPATLAASIEQDIARIVAEEPVEA